MTLVRQHGRRRGKASAAIRSTLLPDPESLEGCRRCELWRYATQAVPGQGPARSALMIVGEQPGDAEDLQGLPFVGPAGRLLDKALEKAGLERTRIFVTNAVKHFKFDVRGKRRLHKKPRAHEIAACNYWLVREIEHVKPRLIVALGTTALSALMGAPLTLKAARETPLEHSSGARVFATYHPSAILRAPPELRGELFEMLCEDLRKAAGLAKKD
jgi:uracil-DNA glycosylase family protein